MMTRHALAEVSVDPTVQTDLQHSPIFQLLRPGGPGPAGPRSVPVTVFTSAVTLEQAVTSGDLPPGTRAVLYDPEDWPFTPPAEQQDPVAAARRAAATAHAHGLAFIAAPAQDLTSVLHDGSGPRWQQFLRLDLIGGMARFSDVVELQAQSLERNTAVYQEFVRDALAQAKEANPLVTVLAGLSTNPPGAVVTSQQLIAAAQATRDIVDGYWLNIPDQGAKCPKCNPTRPGIGIQLLRAEMQQWARVLGSRFHGWALSLVCLQGKCSSNSTFPANIGPRGGAAD